MLLRFPLLLCASLISVAALRLIDFRFCFAPHRFPFLLCAHCRLSLELLPVNEPATLSIGVKLLPASTPEAADHAFEDGRSYGTGRPRGEDGVRAPPRSTCSGMQGCRNALGSCSAAVVRIRTHYEFHQKVFCVVALLYRRVRS